WSWSSTNWLTAATCTTNTVMTNWLAAGVYNWSSTNWLTAAACTANTVMTNWFAAGVNDWSSTAANFTSAVMASWLAAGVDNWCSANWSSTGSYANLANSVMTHWSVAAGRSRSCTSDNWCTAGAV